MKPRKKLPKTAVPRIYFIDQEIASGSYPNAPSMAKKYETSLSSINRDIAYMRDMLGAPIEYDFFKKGFYYTEKTFRLSAAYATADDLLALGMAKSLMDLYRDTPIHDAAMNLLESITVPLKGVSSKWYKDRFVIPEIKTARVNHDIWQSIVTGLKENKVITFNYNCFFTDNDILMKVHPYQIVFNRVNWYLYAYNTENKKKQMFSLNEISDVKITKDSFTIKESFDFREAQEVSFFTEIQNNYFENIKREKLTPQQSAIFSLFYPRTLAESLEHTIISKKTAEYFSIELIGDTDWVKTLKLTDDQDISKTKKGVLFSFSSNEFDNVLKFVLSLGANARPRWPKLLVDRWKATSIKMGKMAESLNKKNN
jgi:predicted DNA-binding transcriptional regulator YafY